MSLNIKDRETHDLAAALAKRKGQSMTRVIRDALRKELAESEREVAVRERYDRIMQIARETSVLIGPEGLPDINDLLYDPVTGLPK